MLDFLLKLHENKILTFPHLTFLAWSSNLWGTVNNLSPCEMSTLAKWQHSAAILTWAVMSFLSLAAGWTNLGGKNDGAVIVETFGNDILLKFCRSTTSLKKLISSRRVLRFSWGSRSTKTERARCWSLDGRAENRKLK